MISLSRSLSFCVRSKEFLVRFAFFLYSFFSSLMAMFAHCSTKLLAKPRDLASFIRKPFRAQAIAASGGDDDLVWKWQCKSTAKRISNKYSKKCDKLRHSHTREHIYNFAFATGATDFNVKCNGMHFEHRQKAIPPLFQKLHRQFQ